MSACGLALASCVCGVEGEHTEHICNNASGSACGGRWIGQVGTPEFTITGLPMAPPQWMFDMTGTTNEEDLMKVMSEDMRGKVPEEAHARFPGMTR